jgi:leukotriene-A4 hydrolase
MATLLSCSTPKKEKTQNTMYDHDVHSFAKPNEVVVTHLQLDLTVDFATKILSGTAQLTLTNNSQANTVHLDANGLAISKILLDDGNATTFQLSAPVSHLGSDLAIAILPTTKTITIYYSTSPTAAALQWLETRQTAGGNHPFLFTQSQAILARTWIPLQDSPGIKFTYQATIHCPHDLMAVMSAVDNATALQQGVYTFHMPHAIPSYLMALAVGNLTYHAYDNRSGVYAEPLLLEKSVNEFVDLPQMISSAEELYGKYAWGRYDLLVLPPSFPFGGMENPCITFATPTIIAGDRSLVSLVAHELAHSWSGNLVTNATWNDFWLNEGFTVYFETRIMEKIYGNDYADMLTLLSLNELKQTIVEMGDTNADTKLFLDLKGRDPDDGVTDIAYQKGRFFLNTIEAAVGRPAWDAFLNKYFTSHAFKTMNTQNFIQYLQAQLIKDDPTLANKIQLEKWIYGTGLPANCPAITSVELNKAASTAAAFVQGKKASDLNTASWTTHHWLYFLRQLGDSISLPQLIELDAAFHFTQTGNSEIMCDWLMLATKYHYKPAYAALEKFLMSVGRRKFIVPLYKRMAADAALKPLALSIYQKAKPGYHTVATATLNEVLKLKP